MSLLDQLRTGPCLTEKHEGVFITEPLRFVSPAKRVGRLPVKFHDEARRP